MPSEAVEAPNGGNPRYRMPLASPLQYIVFLFFLSRLFFFVLGGTFDDSCLVWFYQFLDIDLLENHLFSSLWSLHSQPPLLNLLAGIGLKMPPPMGWWFWRGLFLFLGLAQTLALFDTMTRLGTHPRIAATVLTIYLLSPASILFENFFFYPHLSATLLVWAAWLLTVHLHRPRPWKLAIFFVVCALLPLLRSVFHLIWLLAILLAAVAVNRKGWKKTLLLALIPFALVFGWYTKNYVMLGTFSGSSWMGMNLARATTFRLPVEVREEWVDRGILSEVSRIGPFSPVARYRDLISSPPEFGIPALDAETRGGAIPNYNHFSYIEISKLYERDCWRTLREAPLQTLKQILGGLLIYFRPAQEFALRSGNQGVIEMWEGLFDRWIFWQIAPSDMNRATEGILGTGTLLLSCCYFWVLLYPAMVAFALFRICKEPRRTDAVVYTFLVFNILYISLVGNLFEYGENNRFRFMADPFVLILFGVWITGLTEKFLAKGRAPLRDQSPAL